MPTEKWKAEPHKKPQRSMQQVAVPMTTAQFLIYLDDIRGRVAAGDSWEGHLEYLMPDQGDDPDVQFRVRGMYRIGNLEGQGGYRMIGEFQ